MENPSSPLDTLRQLKEMLDAGALTPTEFEALKKRLVFSEQAPPPGTGASAAPAASPTPGTTPTPSTPPNPAPPAFVPPAPTPAPAPAPPAFGAPVPPATSTPPANPFASGYEPPVARAFEPPAARPQQIITELRSPNLSGTSSKVEEGLNPPVTPRPAGSGASAPPPTPLSQLIVESLNKVPTGGRPAAGAPVTPPAPATRPAPVTPPPAAPRFTDGNNPPPAPPPPPVSHSAPPQEAELESWTDNEFPDSEKPKPRSPLALILSIGGLLALLGLVVYLSLNRPPSERLSSTSQTAADSVAATIETGPQAEPLTRDDAAAPETIRVVPTNPAPPLPRRPTQDRTAVRDFVEESESTTADSSTIP